MMKFIGKAGNWLFDTVLNFLFAAMIGGFMADTLDIDKWSEAVRIATACIWVVITLGDYAKAWAANTIATIFRAYLKSHMEILKLQYGVK